MFGEAFEDAAVGRMSSAEQLTCALLGNADLKAQILAAYMPLVYGRARVAYQEHCPIGELLERGEDAHLEFKSTLRTSAETGELARHLESACLKSLAAFLNSREGGTLLIGVRDDGTPHGLADDFATLAKAGKDEKDLFGLHLS